MNRLFLLLVGLSFSLALESGAMAQSDPGALGPRPTNSGDYGSFSTDAGIGGAQSELLARVYYPTNATGSETFPVVYFLHGAHKTCTASNGAGDSVWPCTSTWPNPVPSYQGYGYVASILASYGMVVISISANGINAIPNPMGNGNTQRVALIRKHIEWWGIANSHGAAPFGLQNRLDFNRMAVVGHSRGGAAVVMFATDNPPAGLRAVLAIAPADNAGGTPVVRKPFALLLGYCDGDVHNLQGLGRFDKARYWDSEDETPKYSFLALGANHSFFNQIWTPPTPGALDDSLGTDVQCGPTVGKRLTAAGQRYIAIGYISAFMRKHMLGATQFESILKGDLALPQPPTNGAVMVGFIPGAPDRKNVSSGITSGALNVNDLGGPIAVTCNGAACPTQSPSFSVSVCSASSPSCRSNTNVGHTTHWGDGADLTAFRFNWTSTGGRISNTLPNLDRDVSNFRTLQFRVSNLPSLPAPATELEQDFSIVLVGADGRRSSVRAQNVSTELYYPPGAPGVSGPKRIVLNTLRVPMSSFTNINLANITAIDLLMDRTTSGNLLVSDMALVDPIAHGFRASYSSLFTYGVQTGNTHNACNWTSTGQVCTMPANEDIHWCYDSTFTAANGRGLLEHDVPVFAAPAGVPSPIAAFADLGFRMVKHTSCQDSLVQLIVTGNACSGTNSSRISGYVCATFPPSTAASELEVVNNTPFPAPGAYYSWGIGTGRVVLNIDIADINNSSNPVQVIQHAAYHGLGWIIGLGARTDQQFLFTSTNVANLKSGWSAAEMCRARSFRYAPDKNKFAIGVYCGPDQ